MLKRFVGRVYSDLCMEEVRRLLESQSPPIKEFNVTVKQFVHNGVGVITRISAAQLLSKNQQWFYKQLEQNPDVEYSLRDFIISDFEPKECPVWLTNMGANPRAHMYVKSSLEALVRKGYAVVRNPEIGSLTYKFNTVKV